MTTPILMPALSPTMEEGKLVKWHVKEGDMVRSGELKAPIVIGRDHLDAGSVASPYRETEAMADGSDAIADWPLLNALVNTAAGATWVSIHHGGGVGIGRSIHAGMVCVADGTELAAQKLERVLTADPGTGVIRHADAALRMLADETGETAVVVRRIGLSSICLHQIESDEPLRVTLEPGTMSPLYAGAPGRVLLAFAPSDVLDEVLAQDLVRITGTTPTKTELRAGLGGIVMTGMATSEGELIEGSIAMAAPVFREDGIVGAIALLGPAFRCDEPWRARAGRLLQEAARAVNAGLADDRTP